MRLKMWCVTIRLKKNDELGGKRLGPPLIDFLTKAGVSGATVWTGMDGFGKRGKSTLKLEGVTVNMPLIIEVIDEQSKLESLLPELKRIVGDNGLVTIQDVYLRSNPMGQTVLPKLANEKVAHPSCGYENHVFPSLG